MKKLIMTTVLVSSLFSGAAFGQGTLSFDSPGAAPILAPGGVASEDPNVVGGLWLAVGSGQSVGSLAFTGITSPIVFSGYFFGGILNFGGPAGTAGLQTLAPGTTVTIQVRAWDTTTGGSFGTATLSGVSQIVDYVLAGSGTPPTLPAEMALTQPIQLVLVPEPSTFALAGLGVAAMLALRRRK